MQVQAKELLLGSQNAHNPCEPKNNDKFLNLLFLPEDEQQVYLAPTKKNDTNSMFGRNSEFHKPLRPEELRQLNREAMIRPNS